MSTFGSGRWVLVAVLCVPLLLPRCVAAACDPAWEESYQKGNSVSAKYTAETDGVCVGTCLEEKLYFYRHAVELCPESDKAQTNLADVLGRLGQYPAAEEHYQRAIAINPQRAEAHFGLGDLAFSAGQYAEAVQQYDQGLAIAPTDSLAKERRATALRLEGQTVVEASVIQQELGGEPLTTMGPGGLKDLRRLPLRIEFDTDKDSIRPEAQPQLKELGDALKKIIVKYPSAAFVIEGHTDVRGSDAHNDDLSRRRAKTVEQALVAQFHIPQDHLAIEGYGKRRVLKPGESDAINQINRRVEVVRHEVGELSKLTHAPVATTVSETAPASPASPGNTPLEAAVFYEDAESRPRKLQDGGTLHSGDGLRVYFRPGQRQYLYVLEQDATKKLFPIFPNEKYGYGANTGAPASLSYQVEPGKEYWVPQSQWLELDQTHGPEVIYFIAASQPRADIEDLLRRSAEGSQRTARATADSSYEIKSMGEINPMGLDSVPREGRKVQVAAPSGGPVEEVPVTKLSGGDLVYTLSFHHE